MSRHALDLHHYVSQDTLALERGRLFSRLWIFAGFASQVRERNQFFSRHIAGVPLLVQRTEAGVRAFLNRCPHRASAIQVQADGKRPLVCPYHAWSFGPEGELRAIPNEGLYRFTAEERADLCLHRLHLMQVGALLFVNLSQAPMTLEAQFSSALLDQLAEVSEHLDDTMIYSRHQVRYNWKLNMENVKDYNHVPFVHPRSFSPIMQEPVRTLGTAAPGDSPVVRMLASAFAPELDSLSYATIAPIAPHESWFGRHCQPYGDAHAYYNWFLYPNVNFCSVRGEHFLLQQYDPVAPGLTDYHLWMMTARRNDPAMDFTALLASLIRGERSVIAEDTQVLEQMQAGLAAGQPRVTHGDYEEHLVQQHLWYRRHVLEDAA